MDRAPAPGSGPRGLHQKYPPCQGGSGFVPSVDAVTSSQALQWLVQPRLLLPPPPAGASCDLPGPSLPPYPRPGIIRGPAPGPPCRPSLQLNPEDEERRRLRRERNKLAAAKCRNRRKELTESLQQETARLEAERAALSRAVAELRRDKERLELALAAHGPVCTAPAPLGPAPRPAAGTRPRPPPLAPPPAPLEPEALHTPTLMATPSLTPFTPSLIFSYPAPGEVEPAAGPAPGQAEPAAGPAPEPCGSAHRRRSSSSSGQSSSSLNSPTLLAL